MRLPREVWVLVVARAVNRLGAFTLPFLAVTLVRGVRRVRRTGGVAAQRLRPRDRSRPGCSAAGSPTGAVRGPTIVVGLLGTALAQLALAAAPSLAGGRGRPRSPLGLVFEVYEPPSQALLADVTTEDQRPVAYGLMAGAMAAAGMAAGLLAAAVAGFDLRWLFVVDAGTCLACAVLVGATLPAVLGGARPDAGVRGLAGPAAAGDAGGGDGVRGGLPPDHHRAAAHVGGPRPAGRVDRRPAHRLGDDHRARAAAAPARCVPVDELRGPGAGLRAARRRSARDRTRHVPVRRSSPRPWCGAWATSCSSAGRTPSSRTWCPRDGAAGTSRPTAPAGAPRPCSPRWPAPGCWRPAVRRCSGRCSRCSASGSRPPSPSYDGWSAVVLHPPARPVERLGPDRREAVGREGLHRLAGQRERRSGELVVPGARAGTRSPAGCRRRPPGSRPRRRPGRAADRAAPGP